MLTFAPGAATPAQTITGAQTSLGRPGFLSELPPTPNPGLRLIAPRRQSRTRILNSSLTIHIHVRNGLVFRDRPVIASGAARTGRFLIASSRRTPIRPGTTAIKLRLTRYAATALRRHHRTTITLTLTTHDAGGTQRYGATVLCTG